MNAIALRWQSWRSVSLRLDQPVTWLALALVALAAAVPTQVGPTLEFMAGNFGRMAPALVGSVALAAYLKAARADALLLRALGGRPLTTIVGASLLGALSPFCSCGVVPIVAGLLGAGVPLAPVMAFWISSPLMSPDMFLITAATLGLPFALAKTTAAIGIGLLGGTVTHWLSGPMGLANPSATGPACACGSAKQEAARPPAAPAWAVWRYSGALSVFTEQFRRLSGKLVQWIAFAFLLESFMQAWLPADALLRWLGPQTAWGIPLAVAVGIPAYLNGYAALPLTAGLMQAGMAPGAALAFLTAGGVTSIPAMLAVHGVVERRIFVLYLALAISGALLAGYGYEAWMRL